MNGGYIIFADDDAEDLALLTGYFTEYSPAVQVAQANSGEALLKLLDDLFLQYGPPLLIVLDVYMPGLNGKQALVAIRSHARYRHTPVVLYSNSELEEAFCQEHGASWVMKPSSVDGVRQIAKVLAEFCQLQFH